MSTNGWIKLHRMLLDKPIWKCSTPEQKTILITILMMANHEEEEWDFNGEKFIVQPGQMITSLKSIVEEAGEGISVQNVRTAIARFEKLGFLTSKVTNKNRLITVENWTFYQSKNADLTKQLTSDQQATNKQLTTNKNEKNVKNVKKREREEDIYIYKHTARARARETSHSLFGKLSNVSLSEAEYEDIESTYQDHTRLINSVSYYLANAKRTYENHYALILKIAEQDGWPKRRKTEKTEERELTPDEMRRQETERQKFDDFIKDLKMVKGDERHA